MDYEYPMGDTSPVNPNIRTVAPDIIFWGSLMIVSGMMDLYIIISNPDYRLPTFGTRPTGVIGWFVKLSAPPIHFLTGYGAILGRKWAYPLMTYYSLYGLINAIVNWIVLPGPHRIRTIFMVGTVFFMGYLYIRRGQFKT